MIPTIGYAIQSTASPFPVFVMTFTLDGFGMALQVLCICNYLHLHTVNQKVHISQVASLEENEENKIGLLQKPRNDASVMFSCITPCTVELVLRSTSRIITPFNANMYPQCNVLSRISAQRILSLL